MRRASGIALLSVLIVTASVSATASWLLYSQHINISRTSQVLEREQSFLFALTLEKFAGDLLKREVYPHGTPNRFYAANKGEGQWWSRTAHLGLLLGGVSGEVFEGVSGINMQIYDLQGLFNINKLLERPVDISGWKGDIEKYPMMDSRNWSQAVIRNILNNEISLADLDDDSDITHAMLFDSLRDWVDPDDSVYNDGAEDAAYSLSQVPYRAGNAGGLAMMQELFFINGFRELSRAQVERLNNLLVPLPISRGSRRLNLLTAPPRLLEYLIEPIVGKEKAAEKARDLREAICEPPINNAEALQAKLKDVLVADIEDANEDTDANADKDADEVKKENEEEKKRIIDWAEHVGGKIFTLASEFFLAHISFRHLSRDFEMNTLFYIDFHYPQDDDRYPVQVLYRYAGPNPYEGLRMHEGASNCPPREEEESDDDESESFAQP